MNNSFLSSLDYFIQKLITPIAKLSKFQLFLLVMIGVGGAIVGFLAPFESKSIANATPAELRFGLTLAIFLSYSGMSFVCGCFVLRYWRQTGVIDDDTDWKMWAIAFLLRVYGFMRFLVLPAIFIIVVTGAVLLPVKVVYSFRSPATNS